MSASRQNSHSAIPFHNFPSIQDFASRRRPEIIDPKADYARSCDDLDILDELCNPRESFIENEAAPPLSDSSEIFDALCCVLDEDIPHGPNDLPMTTLPVKGCRRQCLTPAKRLRLALKHYKPVCSALFRRKMFDRFPEMNNDKHVALLIFYICFTQWIGKSGRAVISAEKLSHLSGRHAEGMTNNYIAKPFLERASEMVAEIKITGWHHRSGFAREVYDIDKFVAPW